MDRTEEQANAGMDFDALQREYWERQLREFPELSTWTGDNRYNDRLTDFSLEAIERRKADERRMLEQASGIHRSQLSGQDRLSHALLLFEWPRRSRREPLNSFPGHPLSSR